MTVRMRWWWMCVPLVAAVGCRAPEPEPSAETGPPRPGDVVRPRLHIPEPWTAGRTTAFGSYLEVVRPGRPDPYDLRDEDAPEGSVRVVGQVAFFAGDAPLGDPVALAFVHDC